ncbi:MULTISPECIES: septum formation family protein [Mycolicibacterium]|uniref:septum formation family protein n=1 Tax=Mycolicibacterium TaxID=1866885 RepID=UPI001F28E595|nr:MULTISPECIES: septum formation family protein [Mycolicibacterium]MCX8558882.1 septum formation family protein [Mycolicibacterium mucogenicum]
MTVRPRRIVWQVAAMSLLAACGSNTSATPSSSTSSASPPTTTTAQLPSPVPIVPMKPNARQAKWVDLQVGDCLSTPPPTDPSVVEVTLVDCSAPHIAEVFLRANVAVNDAIAGVADQRCAAGLTQYAGQDSRYTSTYLIDSNMDRTGHTPLPSTVICLLQSATGLSLNGSAKA